MRLCIGIILLNFVSISAWAYPDIQVRYDFYDIEGDTVLELREEMNHKGFRSANGMSHDAQTEWLITWNYGVENSWEGCRVTSIKTKVLTMFRLPRFIQNDKTSAELKEEWSRYMRALEFHEQGHHQFGLDAAVAIEKKAQSLGWLSDREDLAMAVQEIANVICEDQRRKEVDYDRQTMHGQTQGASFPYVQPVKEKKSRHSRIAQWIGGYLK